MRRALGPEKRNLDTPPASGQKIISYTSHAADRSQPAGQEAWELISLGHGVHSSFSKWWKLIKSFGLASWQVFPRLPSQVWSGEPLAAEAQPRPLPLSSKSTGVASQVMITHNLEHGKWPSRLKLNCSPLTNAIAHPLGTCRPSRCAREVCKTTYPSDQLSVMGPASVIQGWPRGNLMQVWRLLVGGRAPTSHSAVGPPPA